MNDFLLAIDVGNSHTSIGLFDGAKLAHSWRLTTKVSRTDDELWLVMAACLDESGVARERIRSIGIASVVPEATRLYSRLSITKFNLQPQIIGHNNCGDLKILYQPAASVGADRLCGAVAAVSQYGSPVIVVDLGTATVFDVVNSESTYLGGVIAPGVATAVDALHRSTSLLPSVDLEFPESVIGSTTETAIQSGILHGAIEMIDGLIEKIWRALGTEATVVATGGFAPLLQSRSRTIRKVEPDLVLTGIRLIVRGK